MNDPEQIERTTALCAFIAALIHLVDLEGYLAFVDGLASPQAVVAGFSPKRVASAGNWAAIARALLAVKDTEYAQKVRKDPMAMEAVRIFVQQLDFMQEAVEMTTGIVSIGHACPRCGERRVDELIVHDDDTVRCSTCGSEFPI